MYDKVDALKQHVTEASANPGFIHHEWFVQYHLAIVEQIATELCDYYPEADRQLVVVMAWMHDYGKIINYDNEYETTRKAGLPKLLELGFDAAFAEKAISYIEQGDKKLEIDLHEAPLEVQILASADGCSHMVGPFHAIFWKEFSHKSVDELCESKRVKLRKDWDRKIVLPEARAAFQTRYEFLWEQVSVLPERFIKP